MFITPPAWCPQWSEKGFRFPGTGVNNSCESPYVLRIEPGSSAEAANSMAELSSAPHCKTFHGVRGRGRARTRKDFH